MPLSLEDDETAGLVSKPARASGVIKSDAVRRAVTAELSRLIPQVLLCERLAALRTRHPLPKPTGQAADKAFFDDLSGE